jgi:membrane-bound lytic murein transglycosylase D
MATHPAPGTASIAEPAPTAASGAHSPKPTPPASTAKPSTKPVSAAAGVSTTSEEAGLLDTEAAPPAEQTADTPSTQEDLWARVRRGYALTPLDTETVKRWEQFYLRRPDYLQRMFERGGRYLFHIVEETTKRGLPTELALLPFIESAFNPNAQSSARASGMWQFMPATGKSFDLRQNLFRDDRRSVLDSTRAALDYLSQLHTTFGDWHLALAAYNWGQGNVGRALEVNRRRGLGQGYLDLNMPDETRNYVPKLQAIINLVNQPEAYGLQLPPLLNHPYFLTVGVDRDIDVSLAARLAGVSLDDFQALNPQLNKPVILAAGTPKILLPYENARQYQRALADHRGVFATWTAWVAPRTLRPAEAARLVGMSEDRLRDVNRIPPRMMLKAGSTLLVPRSPSLARDVSEHVADTAALSLVQERPPGRKRVVKIGPRGESVAAIAARYRVPVQQLATWNNTSVGGSFRAGQSVVFYTSAPTARAASSRAGAKPVSKPRTGTGKPAAAPAPKRKR